MAHERPQDAAAQSTKVDLENQLREQYGVTAITWRQQTAELYEVQLTSTGQGGAPVGTTTYPFATEEAYRLYEQLQSDPRYLSP